MKYVYAALNDFLLFVINYDSPYNERQPWIKGFIGIIYSHRQHNGSRQESAIFEINDTAAIGDRTFRKDQKRREASFYS